MPLNRPGGASSAALGRDCCLHRFQSRARHAFTVRSRTPVQAEKAQERVSGQPLSAAYSNGNGASNSAGNGASNGTTKQLISSNNGVVLDRKGGSLEDRILSGEFSRSQGSFKEKASRPLRQALAKDPLGPGAAHGLDP